MRGASVVGVGEAGNLGDGWWANDELGALSLGAVPAPMCAQTPDGAFVGGGTPGEEDGANYVGVGFYPTFE